MQSTCEDKHLLSSLQCTVLPVSVPWVCIDWDKALYQVFYIYICSENLVNFVGESTLTYSE